jgi:hypothetical protein
LTLVVASIPFSISFAYFIPEFGEIIIPPGLFYFPAYNITTILVKQLSLENIAPCHQLHMEQSKNIKFDTRNIPNEWLKGVEIVTN